MSGGWLVAHPAPNLQPWVCLFGEFSSEVETGFSLKPLWYFYRISMLYHDFAQPRRKGSRAGPGPVDHAKKRWRLGPFGLPERQVEPDFFGKLNFKFSHINFLGAIQCRIA